MAKVATTLFLLPLILTFVASQENSTEVTISLFATDLNGCDDLSACDTKVKILCQSVSSDWHTCGETQKMQDDNFPIWPERFTFQYVQSDHQQWRFDVIDVDTIIDDPLGSISLTMEEFMTETEIQPTMKFELDDGHGYFYVHRRII